MADYANLALSVRYGEVSDYSDGLLARNVSSSSTTVDEQEARVITALTTGTTLDLGHFTTIEYVMVKNKDATNYVTAKCVSAVPADPSDFVTQKIPAGKFIVLTDLTVAGDLLLTADTADCDCEVIIIGT